MNRQSQTLALSVLLASFLCAITIGGSAATPMLQMQQSGGPTSQRNTNGYGKLDQTGGGNLLKYKLDSIGIAALKNEDVGDHLTKNLQNDYNEANFAHNKKFYSHRKSESPDSPKRYSEAVYYPAELINIGNSKRNFDEIDRSSLSGFDERNFDEIDRNGFSGFDKRNIDEIDRNGFSGFNKRNFDEIDRSSFSDFNKRNFEGTSRDGFSNFNERNFDEIDRTGFSGFNRRNFDEIDRNGLPSFAKRSIVSRLDDVGRQRR